MLTSQKYLFKKYRKNIWKGKTFCYEMSKIKKINCADLKLIFWFPNFLSFLNLKA